MTHIVVAIGWLAISILTHFLLNKLRLYVGISRSALLGVFIVGCIGCVATYIWYLPYIQSANPLPLTGICLYIALSLAYMSITASPTLGDQSPSCKIIMHLIDRPSTKKQLISLFTVETIIGKRISDLIDSKCMIKRKHEFVITKRGKYLAEILSLYRKLLNLSEGG